MPRSVAATLPPPAALRPATRPARRALAGPACVRRACLPDRRTHVLRLELARLELTRELCVDLGVGRRRLSARLLLALHLELAPALELEDLEDEHEVDAGRQCEHPEACHHDRPAEVEVPVVVAV